MRFYLPTGMTENMPTEELDVMEPNRDTGEYLTVPSPAYSFYVPDKVIGMPVDFDRCVKRPYSLRISD